MTHVLYLLLVSAALLWGYNVGQLSPQVTNSDHRAVKSVCDYSRHIINGDWEDACATAQDATNTRYTCNPICNVKELKS